MDLGAGTKKKCRLTCYSKAPFVKLYCVVDQMHYTLHGVAFALDYTVTGRQKRHVKM